MANYQGEPESHPPEPPPELNASVEEKTVWLMNAVHRIDRRSSSNTWLILILGLTLIGATAYMVHNGQLTIVLN